jgi:hypothetical protein
MHVAHRKHRSRFDIAAVLVFTFGNPNPSPISISDLRRNLEALLSPDSKSVLPKLKVLRDREEWGRTKLSPVVSRFVCQGKVLFGLRAPHVPYRNGRHKGGNGISNGIQTPKRYCAPKPNSFFICSTNPSLRSIHTSERLVALSPQLCFDPFPMRLLKLWQRWKRCRSLSRYTRRQHRSVVESFLRFDSCRQTP